MNIKIKRGLGILLLLVLSLTILTTIQSTHAYNYGCCFHPNNFCQNTATAQECCGEESCPPSIFNPNTPCAETKCEWQGCCHQTCDMTQYKDCNYGFTPIADLAPTYTCDSAPECSEGCCLYLTQENEIGNCEIKSQQQCQPEVFFPNVQFYTDLTVNECNALCEQI